MKTKLKVINTKPEIKLQNKYDFDKFPIDLIVLGDNIRIQYKQSDLLELANSIKENGQLQAVGITDQSDGKFKLVYGHRRFFAIRDTLKEKTIKVVLVSDYQDRVKIQLVENIQREDLSDIEIATALKDLADASGLSSKDLALMVNKSEDWVKAKLSHLKIINNLNKNVTSHFKDLETEKVKLVRALKPEIQTEILQKAKNENWSVKQIREKVKEQPKENRTKEKERKPYKKPEGKYQTDIPIIEKIKNHIEFLESDKVSMGEKMDYIFDSVFSSDLHISFVDVGRSSDIKDLEEMSKNYYYLIKSNLESITTNNEKQLYYKNKAVNGVVRYLKAKVR